MRLEWRVLIGAAAALSFGSLCAQDYARVVLPLYAEVARWIAAAHPWQIVSVDVVASDTGPGAIVRLTGAVFRQTYDRLPAAMLISKLQVAAIMESPVIFWSFLVLWPARSWVERLAIVVAGIPAYLGLEAITTVFQLLNPLAYGSAVLAGDPDPLTLWERWSRFLEGGGRIAVAISGAIIVVTVIRAARRHLRLPPGFCRVFSASPPRQRAG